MNILRWRKAKTKRHLHEKSKSFVHLDFYKLKFETYILKIIFFFIFEVIIWLYHTHTHIPSPVGGYFHLRVTMCATSSKAIKPVLSKLVGAYVHNSVPWVMGLYSILPWWVAVLLWSYASLFHYSSFWNRISSLCDSYSWEVPLFFIFTKAHS